MSSRKELANAIRALSMDAVQKAKSGHPGAPMGMADIAEVLWRDFLKHNPQNPSWADRDRFVLSNGHGSMLIYSLLHLTGYDLPMEELKNFRQLHSKTPGHPEVGYTAGVETTTGPLGQGIANAVGMAIAEKTLAAQFNRPGHDIVDHYTYAFMGDGCMMEGISHEVCSLAGTLKLGKLIAFYDDNGISIDGHVEGWFTDDTAMRFEAYGWHVIRDIDGHDAASIKRAVEEARAVTDKPSLLMCKTIIGFGSPNKAGTHDSHGAPLGDAEIALTREQLGWKYAPFEIPSEIYAQWDAKEAGQAKESAWNEKFAAYAKAYPQEAAEFTRRMKGEMPSDFDAKAKEFIAKLQANPAKIASRKASQNAIEAFGPLLPEFLGGSADLAPSNKTNMSDAGDFSKADYAGRNMHFGVRELAMTAIGNGMMLHGGLRTYVSTFFVFSDYTKPMARLSALMKMPLTFVFTHDSIGVGEDGPTHEPIEQLAMFRAMPNFHVFRPCDATETAAAWYSAVTSKTTPTALVLSRQNLAPMPGSCKDALKGGYVIDDCEGTPDLILIASGSEVELSVKAKEILAAEGRKVRVVSMPCMDLFEEQSAEYKESVLPKEVRKRVAVEALSDFGWGKYVGLDGACVTMTGFGASGPAAQLFEHFGFTAEHVADVARSL